MTEKSPFESMTPESIKSEMLGRVINAGVDVDAREGSYCASDRSHRSITPQRTKGTPVGWRQYHCGYHPRHGYSDDRIRSTRHSQ